MERAGTVRSAALISRAVSHHFILEIIAIYLYCSLGLVMIVFIFVMVSMILLAFAKLPTCDDKLFNYDPCDE